MSSDDLFAAEEQVIAAAQQLVDSGGIADAGDRKLYAELLKDTPLKLPVQADWAESVWHLYVVRHPKRDALKKHLEDNGVGCALHYPLPLHLQKCYAHLGYKEGAFPVSEKAARECLSLPIYPELTDAQIQRVADVIKDFFKKN